VYSFLNYCSEELIYIFVYGQTGLNWYTKDLGGNQRESERSKGPVVFALAIFDWLLYEEPLLDYVYTDGTSSTLTHTNMGTLDATFTTPPSQLIDKQSQIVNILGSFFAGYPSSWSLPLLSW
jgi:hypothetical protein